MTQRLTDRPTIGDAPGFCMTIHTSPPAPTSAPMIDLYYWTTPNGHKITMFLEAKMKYRVIPVNIGKGEQFDPAFLKVSPNNRIPAIVDHKPAQLEPKLASWQAGAPDELFMLFESGAILFYLADKSKKFSTASRPDWRKEAIQWLFWQMGGWADGRAEPFTLGLTRPKTAVTNQSLGQRDGATVRGDGQTPVGPRFLAGIFHRRLLGSLPWVVPHERQQMNLTTFRISKRWFEVNQGARPATIRAYQIAKDMNTTPAAQANDGAALTVRNSEEVASHRGANRNERLPRDLAW